jgi:hypothetical protein
VQIIFSRVFDPYSCKVAGTQNATRERTKTGFEFSNGCFALPSSFICRSA